MGNPRLEDFHGKPCNHKQGAVGVGGTSYSQTPVAHITSECYTFITHRGNRWYHRTLWSRGAASTEGR